MSCSRLTRQKFLSVFLLLQLISVVACAIDNEEPIPELRSKKPCPETCPCTYEPVCVVDGYTRVTIINECVMNMVNCRNHKSYYVYLNDECPQPEKGFVGIG
ncbi:unnamed protein product [Hermetia illucens]|uniref:Kazal-like domain-containing protein n=1 Tax=Hermetia illucens TaxID=343691 RepID=A0A7R8YT55_HERIL|nr:uncharacterized protein LOC119649943 [Hermetia illucens]CAD7081329.1 unnamed protein product [Hermetia illucens]